MTSMGRMFTEAATFNQDTGGWAAPSVTTMRGMFSAAHSFNQDIGAWDMPSVNTISLMFSQAVLFAQNLSNWCLSSTVLASSALEGTQCESKYCGVVFGECLTGSKADARRPHEYVLLRVALPLLWALTLTLVLAALVARKKQEAARIFGVGHTMVFPSDDACPLLPF